MPRYKQRQSRPHKLPLGCQKVHFQESINTPEEYKESKEKERPILSGKQFFFFNNQWRKFTGLRNKSSVRDVMIFPSSVMCYPGRCINDCLGFLSWQWNPLATFNQTYLLCNNKLSKKKTPIIINSPINNYYNKEKYTLKTNKGDTAVLSFFNK